MSAGGWEHDPLPTVDELRESMRESLHSAAMVAAGERLAFQIDEAVRLELVLAFTLDRPMRPVTLASPTGGIVRVELAPEDQARLYL